MKAPRQEDFPSNVFSFGRFNALFALAKADSMTKAARVLGRDAASVSRDIKELETFFGCKLRQNSGKTVCLSPEGHELVGLLRRQTQVLQDFRERSASNLSSVSFGAGDSLLHLSLFPKLSDIHAKFENTTIHVAALSTFEIIQGLQNYTLDLGILREDSLPKKRAAAQTMLDYTVLGEYRYAVFIPRKLLDKRNPEEGEVFALPFAMIKNHWNMNFVELAAEKGVAINKIRVWCENFTEVVRLVTLTDYVGILPIFCSAFTPQEKFTWFEPTFLRGHTHRIVLAWNRSLLEIRKHLRPFVDLVSERLKF